MKNMEIKRGDVVLCDLSQGLGSEQQGVRPCIVVQNDIGNRYSPTVVIVPVTSVISKRKLPTHVSINKGSFGLEKDSTITCEGLRVVDKQRFINRIGKIDTNTMLKVDNAMSINLGLIN